MPNVGSERIANRLPNALITTSGSRAGRRLYLSFDDGPSPGVTEPLLDALDTHGVPASFFCIGEKVRRYPRIAENILARGHGLYNHSDSHRNFRSLSLAEQLRDASACQSAIDALRPASRAILRAPRGQLGLAALALFRARGWRVVHWSYDSLDYRKPAAGRLVERFGERPVRGGDIVLFHDDSALCIEVLNTMLPRWIVAGYDFATVETLFTR